MAKGVKPVRPKVKVSKQGKGGGAPSTYQETFNKQVYKLCLLGATDKKIADFFNVDERTINNWKVKYKKFFQSIVDGRDKADATVAESLYKRACGYSHSDVDIRVVDKKIVQTRLIKHYPPDTAAAIMWLTNRQKAQWRNKQEIDHGGQVDNPIGLVISKETVKAISKQLEDEV